MQENIQNAVESTPFQLFIMGIIVLNAITLGVQTFDLPESVSFCLAAFDNICLGIYIVETILKLFSYRWSYFRNGWNVFDFTVIALSLVSLVTLAVPTQIARIIRIFRAFETFRLVSAFRNMRVIVEAIVKAIPGVFSTGILMLIVFYIYAVIGTVAFCDAYPEKFGSLAASMYTLFQVLTLEGWSESISRPLIAVHSWASVYFVTFIIISAFVMINVIVGIVVGTIDESRKKYQAEVACESDETKGAQHLSAKDELREIKKHLEALEELIGK